MLLVLRSDGGVYLGRAEVNSHYIDMTRGVIRVGSSAAICHALSEAFAEMEAHLRAPSEPKAEGGEDAH
jgi:hypothetical protein